MQPFSPHRAPAYLQPGSPLGLNHLLYEMGVRLAWNFSNISVFPKMDKLVERSGSGFGDLVPSLSHLAEQPGAPRGVLHTWLADTTPWPFQVCGPPKISHPGKLSHAVYRKGQRVSTAGGAVGLGRLQLKLGAWYGGPRLGSLGLHPGGDEEAVRAGVWSGVSIHECVFAGEEEE